MQCKDSRSIANKISEGVTAQTKLKSKLKAPIGRIAIEDLEKLYGESWDIPNVKQSTIDLLSKLNIEIVQPEQPAVREDLPEEESVENIGEDPEDEDAEDDGAARPSVKALMKKRGLYDKVPENYLIIAKFSETRKRMGKNDRSLSCERLRQIFSFASKKKPEKSPWELLVDHLLCFEYLCEARDFCHSSAGTLLTYAKDMVALAECAKDRWVKHSDYPKTPEFQDDLRKTHTFWKDQQALLDKKCKAKKRQDLSTGREKVADLEKCYEYLEDEKVKTEVSNAFDRLGSAQRLSDRLKITRGDTALLEAWNTVMRYISMNIIIRNGCRTGVIENMRITEFEAANRLRGKWIVYVASHKREEDGAAKIRMREEDHAILSRFVKIRRAVRVKQPHQDLLFVTTGGQPFRSVHEHINKWMADHKYPKLTTNMVRKAIQVAAAAQGTDMQTDVCSHLAHSLLTAENNYRSRDLEAAVRASDSVESCQDNYRALKIASSDTRAFFEGNTETFPTIEDLNAMFRRRMKKETVQLTAKTYADIREVWTAEFRP